MDHTLLKQAISQLETIGDFVRFATTQFEKANLHFGHGTDNAFDEAIFLSLYALHLGPQHYSPELLRCRLLEQEKHALCELYRRRVNERIPAAYLTNSMTFAGLDFYVDERVLVPRSPIAEIILAAFSPWSDEIHVNSILDLCTGSACIAIAAAHAFPEASVDAVDISQDALQVAQQNIAKHDMGDRVRLYQSDLFSGLPSKKYDIIISNPPYVTTHDLTIAPKEYHAEPKIGLAAGEDGLDVVKTILQQARSYMTDEGILVVEVGASAPHLIHAFPEMPFIWLEFEHGGEGVFLLRAQDL